MEVYADLVYGDKFVGSSAPQGTHRLIKTFDDKISDESHLSLRDNYEVTGYELDVLTEAARSNKYCLGSRMTGAGFGGWTVSIVQKSGVEDFQTRVTAEYEKKIGYKPSFYDCTIEDGIIVEKL